MIFFPGVNLLRACLRLGQSQTGFPAWKKYGFLRKPVQLVFKCIINYGFYYSLRCFDKIVLRISATHLMINLLKLLSLSTVGNKRNLKQWFFLGRRLHVFTWQICSGLTRLFYLDTQGWWRSRDPEVLHCWRSPTPSSLGPTLLLGLGSILGSSKTCNSI